MQSVPPNHLYHWNASAPGDGGSGLTNPEAADPEAADPELTNTGSTDAANQEDRSRSEGGDPASEREANVESDGESLCTALAAVVEGHADRLAVRRLVEIVHDMAVAYIRSRPRAGLPRDLSASDIAMDAIGDLFERTDDGRFPVIESFVRERADAAMRRKEVDTIRSCLCSATDAAIMKGLRPLVFRYVADRLFSQAGETDPSLSRLIRSVKRAARDHPSAGLTRRGRTLVLHADDNASTNGDASKDETTGAAEAADRTDARSWSTRRPLSLDRLEAYLTRHVRDGVQVPDLVDATLHLMTRTDGPNAVFPVTHVARAIRTATVRVGLNMSEMQSGARPPSPTDALAEEEVQSMLQSATTSVREEKWDTYVATGKVQLRIFDLYVKAVQDYLVDTYAPASSDELSQYDALSNHMPDLSRATYRSEHRATFEYLVQVTRRRFLRLVEREYLMVSPGTDDDANSGDV